MNILKSSDYSPFAESEAAYLTHLDDPMSTALELKFDERPSSPSNYTVTSSISLNKTSDNTVAISDIASLKLDGTEVRLEVIKISNNCISGKVTSSNCKLQLDKICSFEYKNIFELNKTDNSQ